MSFAMCKEKNRNGCELMDTCCDYGVSVCVYDAVYGYLLSEIARKNGGKVEARSWLPVGLRRDTYFGISLTWSYPGLADGLSVAIQSAARATSLEVFSKFIGERYPSAECRRWRLYQSSMY